MSSEFGAVTVLKRAGLEITAERFGAIPLTQTSIWILIDVSDDGRVSSVNITDDRSKFPPFVSSGYDYVNPAGRRLVEEMIGELTTHFTSIAPAKSSVEISFGVISEADPSAVEGVKIGTQRWHLEIALKQSCCGWLDCIQM